MLGLMGFSGSLPLYVIHRYYIFVFIDRANKDACLLACLMNVEQRLAAADYTARWYQANRLGP